jgi:hypothetical protein
MIYFRKLFLQDSLNKAEQSSKSEENKSLIAKIKHIRRNKTHKTLTRKILFGIRHSVTKVTVFETSEGIGERSRETLGESNSRAV